MNAVFCSWSLFIIIAFYLYGFNLLVIKDKLTSLVISVVVAMFSFKLESLLFITIVYFVIISLILLGLSRIVKIRLAVIVLIAFVMASGLSIYGYFNMNNIVQTEYSLNTKIGKKIMMISDMHYPVSLDRNKLGDVVDRINKENVDMVILNGDIVDENTSYTEMVECFEVLGKLDRRIYYIMGNHELVDYGVKRDYSYEQLVDNLTNNGIKILADEVERIGNVVLYGVNDKSVPLFNKDDFVIVADHEPNDLMATSKKNVDLHLSGHVHGGQLFGVKFIYDSLGLFDNSYGAKYFGDMLSINTSGISGWGFNCKSQGKAEIVKISI